jgi:hypothetical protein
VLLVATFFRWITARPQADHRLQEQLQTFVQLHAYPAHYWTNAEHNGFAFATFRNVELAMMAHQRLALHLPFFNSDIAITDMGRC